MTMLLFLLGVALLSLGEYVGRAGFTLLATIAAIICSAAGAGLVLYTAAVVFFPGVLPCIST